MAHQNLTIHVGTGADADHRHIHRRGNFLGDFSGDLFNHDGKGSSLFQEHRIPQQGVRLFLIASAHLIGAKGVNRLGSQTQVPHDRNAHAHHTAHRFTGHFAPFHLDRFHARLFDHAARVAQGFIGIDLVAHERQVAHHKGTFHTTAHQSRVIEHVVQSHGHRGVETLDHHGHRVPH